MGAACGRHGIQDVFNARGLIGPERDRWDYYLLRGILTAYHGGILVLLFCRHDGLQPIGRRFLLPHRLRWRPWSLCR